MSQWQVGVSQPGQSTKTWRGSSTNAGSAVCRALRAVATETGTKVTDATITVKQGPTLETEAG